MKKPLKTPKRIQQKREKRNLNSKAKQKEYRIFKQKSQSIVLQLFKTIIHFFPGLFERIRQIEDYRKSSDYELAELITACIAMFLFKEDSRNAFNNDRKDGNFINNYKRIFKMHLPHMDTVDRVMRHLEPNELEQLKTTMIQALLNKKTLHKFRLFKKWFIVAVDGSGVMSFTKRHCGHCLTKTSKKGKKTYFHNVLEAKLICPNGFAISLATEWIENPEGDYKKQDCELKAFKRLAEKLKKSYPRLPICITTDGLYPNQTFFSICKNNNWSFITTLQDGNLPSVQEEAQMLRNITDGNKYNQTIIRKGKKIHREYSWANEIPYHGFILNWIECIETVETIKSGQIESKKFVHVTDFNIEKANAAKISQSGRLRWKIENEGFNTQKNQGYNLKHKFSRVSLTATKNYYQCMQIAHLINQLFILSAEFKKFMQGKTTIKQLWKCMLGFLIYCNINCKEISKIIKLRIQFRYG